MTTSSTQALPRENEDPVHAGLGSLRNAHICLLIILVVTVVYAKSGWYQYTYSDDTQLLVVNEEFVGNPANLPKLFTTDVFISLTNPEVFYRPVLNILFMLELQVTKNSPVVFHVTNILLHIGCSLLLFVLLQQLGLSKVLASAAALIFSVHPLNTSAVVWIPGRNDTLLTLLVLGSFSLFLRALDTKRRLPLVGHMLLFFLALLTKETAVALPILTLTYLSFIRRERPPRRTILLWGSAYGVLFAAWFVLRHLVHRTYWIDESLPSLTLGWLKNAPAFLLYLGKTLLPFNLTIFPNLTDESLILGALSLLLLAAAYFLERPASNRQLLWGLGWFFLFLAPTFLSANLFHEHRCYCSFAGLLFAVAQLPIVQKIHFEKTVHVLLFVAVLAIFGALAMIHSEHFRNRTAYATSAFRSSPSADISVSALAGLLLDEGNDSAAAGILEPAIARKPEMLAVHRMLGDIYAGRREYGRAANEYETSIRLEPLQLYTYINYGKMCLEVGRRDDAARLWKRSVFINPEFLLGYYYLANYYVRIKNDPDSAMMYAKQIQQRGVTVTPELLRAIQENPLYGKKN